MLTKAVMQSENTLKQWNYGIPKANLRPSFVSPDHLGTVRYSCTLSLCIKQITEQLERK